MILIIGLGNPGEKFKNTRHNLGFMTVDAFAEKNNFPEFKLSKNFNSLISERVIDDEKIILVKPQTFMNQSGKAVKKIIENCKSTLRGVRFASRKIENLLVVHDDLDLPLDKIRIVKNRGAAGHKGIESVIREIGTKDFVRFRIGIQPLKVKLRNAEGFVLQRFNREEKEIIKKVIKNTIEAIELTSREGLEKSMSKYNK